LPHLLASASTTMPWRTLMPPASALATIGGALVIAVVRDGPYLAGSSRFDASAVSQVFVERGTRLASLGYLGPMWELYADWTWIAAFASASFGVTGGATPSSPAGSAVAFTTIGSGAIGSVAAGWFADRIGKARVAAWAMSVSGTCCAAAGFVFHAPAPLLVVFAVVWGAAVVADSAQLSALVAEYSPRDHVGTALTIRTAPASCWRWHRFACCRFRTSNGLAAGVSLPGARIAVRRPRAARVDRGSAGTHVHGRWLMADG